MILIPEIPFDIQKVADKVMDREKHGSTFSIIVVAEGAMPKGGTAFYMAPGRLGGVGFSVTDQLNQMTGKDGTVVRWNQESIERFFADTLLLYLAVAHFGRGRGDWSRSEHPEHWRSEVRRVIENDSSDLPKLAQGGAELDPRHLEEAFERCAGWAIERVLRNLYPDSKLPKMGL